MSIKWMEAKAQLSDGNAFAERNLTHVPKGHVTCATFFLLFLLPANTYKSLLCQALW